MGELRYVHLGFGPRAVPYEEAWAEQRRLHAARVADEVPDTCLLLEHEPVYTAGRRTNSWDRPVDGSKVVDVDRGGRITWHGPGQIVGYPILRLPEPMDVVAHVRRLEEAIIQVCAEFGVAATRVDGRSGVWVPADPSTGRPERKVCAIGVRVSRGVTMHGFALNCDCALDAFNRIVPCGISDAGVTSLSVELRRKVTVAEVLPLARRHLAGALEADPVRVERDARVEVAPPQPVPQPVSQPVPQPVSQPVPQSDRARESA